MIFFFVLLHWKEGDRLRWRIFLVLLGKNPHPFGEPLSVKGHNYRLYCSINFSTFGNNFSFFASSLLKNLISKHSSDGVKFFKSSILIFVSYITFAIRVQFAFWHVRKYDGFWFTDITLIHISSRNSLLIHSCGNSQKSSHHQGNSRHFSSLTNKNSLFSLSIRALILVL